MSFLGYDFMRFLRLFFTPYYIYVLATLMLSSCIDDYELPQTETEPYVVVYGEIVSERDCLFRLRSSMSLGSSLSMYHYIPNAHISVMGTDGQCFDSSPVEGQQGTYTVPVGKLDPSCQYYARINTPYGTFESEPMQPLDAPDIVEVMYEQPHDDKTVDLLVSTDDPHRSVCLLWRIEDFWEIRTPYVAHWEYRPDKAWDGSGEFVQLTPDEYTNHGWRHANDVASFLSNESYGCGAILHHCILQRANTSHRLRNRCCSRVHQMAITREEYEFHYLQQTLTTDVGGLFSRMPSELPTNIHRVESAMNPVSGSSSSYWTDNIAAQAIGYVGVRGYVSTEDIYINGSDIGYRNPGSPSYVPEEKVSSPFQMYIQGYRVVDYTEEKTYWTRCQWVDYRSEDWGGGEALDSKPEWWE